MLPQRDLSPWVGRGGSTSAVGRESVLSSEIRLEKPTKEPNDFVWFAVRLWSLFRCVVWSLSSLCGFIFRLCFCSRISQGHEGDGYKKPPPQKQPKKPQTKTKSNQNQQKKTQTQIQTSLCVWYFLSSLCRGHFAGTLCCTDLEISACLCLFLHLLHRCSLCFRGKTKTKQNENKQKKYNKN